MKILQNEKFAWLKKIASRPQHTARTWILDKIKYRRTLNLLNELLKALSLLQ